MTVVKKLTPLYTKKQIQHKVAELGAQIAADYKGEELICVCVLKGAVFFFTDLVRAVGEGCPDLIIDFLRASSYGDGMSTSSVVKITKDVDVDVRGRNVLFVEDVIDSGVTMSKLIPMFRQRGAKSVRLCALIDKRERR
ncbi:MAG: phosphoribosyltransferase, partial [Succinivibrio sp.]